MFPVEPHFYSICFAQSSPLISFIAGSRGSALHRQWSFYFGEPPMFQVYVCDGPIKMAHCPPIKKKKTWEASPI